MKKVTVIMFMILLLSTSIMHVVFSDNDISFSERRKLDQFPKLTLEALMEGKWIEDFEGYLLDQMPFREKFRSLKAFIELNVFNKSDVNGYFKWEEHIFKNSDIFNEKMLDNFVEYVKRVQGKYLDDNNVFISIIPDKNYFLNDKHLKIDYENINKTLIENFDCYISLFDIMSLEDYYLTDPHWKQENLKKVLEELSERMSFEYTSLSEYTINQYAEFLGAYAAQSGIYSKEEVLTYLSLRSFDDLIITDYEDEDVKEVYLKENLEGIDPYDIFLSGASPLITIENPNSSTEKELIIFRDSFGSSLTPLLIDSYSKITLVDTRYVGYEYLGEYIDFEDQDVLFLYSTLVVNNSIMLK